MTAVFGMTCYKSHTLNFSFLTHKMGVVNTPPQHQVQKAIIVFYIFKDIFKHVEKKKVTQECGQTKLKEKQMNNKNM